MTKASQLTAGCLFSGMGGLAAGLVRAGFSIRWATDADPFAAVAFRHKFRGVRFVETDVRDLSVQGDQLAKVDLLAAGFPCQSFSQAGGRRGFDDPRGRLFFEIPRLIGEFEPDERPRLVVLENVPNLLYGDGGSWFAQVRRALRRAGYWFRIESCWIANVMKQTELPQDRERLFMVAASRTHFSHNPYAPPRANGAQPPTARPLDRIVDRSRPGPSEAYLPPDNRYYKMINQQMSQGKSRDNLYQLRRSYVREKKDGLCPTLTANMGIGGHNVPFLRDQWGIRRLTVREVALLQGFPASTPLFPEMPEAEQYRLLGNATCVQLARILGHQCARLLLDGLPR